MIRLLVVTNLFHPDFGGGAAVFSDLCYALAERGFDVTVQCAYPYYPEWKDKSGTNGWRIFCHKDKGVKVERHGLFIPGNPNSLLQRLLYEASFFFSLLRSLPKARKDFDVIMVFCPLVASVAYASCRKLFYGTPFWLSIQDLSAEAAEASGISKSAAINRLFRWIQTLIFNQADIWSSISPVMIERLKHIVQKNQPILYQPNWVHVSLLEQIDALPEKTGRSISHPVKLLYAGNIGKKQDLLRFCKALKQSDAQFEFRIHADGGEAGNLQQWIKQSCDKRFRFNHFLDESGFAQVLHDADMFVITEKQGSGGAFIPSKLIPGIRSGTPILAICDVATPLGQEMQQTKAGYRFSWSQLPQLSDFINNLPTNKDYPTWQKNALARSAFYDRDKIISQFETVLRSIVSHRPTQTDTDGKNGR
jgi:glycosyltransferase involved in cell wall biosynthesis